MDNNEKTLLLVLAPFRNTEHDFRVAGWSRKSGYTGLAPIFETSG
jgi:hypothetical protein